jgi:hypothetical protein
VRAPVDRTEPGFRLFSRYTAALFAELDGAGDRDRRRADLMIK